MDLYAIRKNQFAGVYSNKEMYEYMKSKEAHCSVRVFLDSEKKEALKWAGVKEVDLIPQALKSDGVFNSMFGEVSAKKVSDKKNNSCKKDVTFKLHSVCIKKSVSVEAPKEVFKIKDLDDNKFFLTSLDEFIDKNRKKYNGFLIKTKNNGDIFYLSRVWYYEKHWDVEYGYSIEDLIKCEFIVYKLNSFIEKLDGGYRLENAYSLNSDILNLKEKVIVLPYSEIVSVTPQLNDCVKAEVDGRVEKFKNTKEVSKIIKSMVGNLK